jgi:CRISPR-associated protein Csm1
MLPPTHQAAKIYLAALLHDIGKFAQRAEAGSSKDSTYLKTYGTSQDESLFCPLSKNGNYYTHKHVLWTAAFITEHKLFFNELLKEEATYNITESLLHLAAKHHAPQSDAPLQLLIQQADWLASGIDRTADVGMQEGEKENEKDFKQIKLISIFENIDKETNEEHVFTKNFEHDIVALNAKDKSYFPNTDKKNTDYSGLWKRFNNEFKKGCYPKKDFRAFAETLLHLLHKYIVTIPASTIHLPDVSLYDHTKAVAAFALCLYQYQIEKKQPIGKSDTDEAAFLLVGAKLSGVQSFIYSIASKKAAKNLKGRSFYLQLVIDTLLYQFLEAVGLYGANVVYASGGGFYLLAPNIPQVHEQIALLRKKIQEELFQRHALELFVCFDSVPFTLKEVYDHQVSKIWADLDGLLNKQKRARYAEKLTDNYNAFFMPQGVGGDSERDAMTGMELVKGNTKILDEDQKLKVSKVTHALIDLGEDLRKAKSWLITSEKNDVLGVEGFEFLGWYHYLLPDNEKVDRVDKGYLFSLTESLHFLNEIVGHQAVEGFTFYGGHDFPKARYGRPLSFDELAGSREDNFKRLGILRMDVDNLGQIFQSGFRKDRVTFSRMSTLSRNLDYFFKGRLNAIRNQDNFRDDIFILYSGGDDLFIVGEWDKTIAFAEQIHIEFKSFTCHNEKISLSGGVAIVPGKFPIAQAAHQAGEAEEKAKNHRIGSAEKNAIAILDIPMNWELEYPTVLLLRQEMRKYLEGKQLSFGFIQKVMRFAEMARKKNLAWKWQLVYDLSRNTPKDASKELKEFLEKFKHAAFCNLQLDGSKLRSEYTFIELAGLAARITQFDLR